MFKKFVYLFKEGNASMATLLGGKGANLCEMTKLKLPIPVGFIISTEACLDFNKKNELSKKVVKQIVRALKKIESQSGKVFGKSDNALILSVRSGARVSMPGMMDTILNLGLNDEIVKGFAKQNNPRFAYDCYRRFIQMYSNVVKGINLQKFENELEKLKNQLKIKLDSELNEDNLKDLINSYKSIYKKETDEDFPQNIKKQLFQAIQAVFRSWENPRAVLYRKINNIPDDWGTAVNVQEMVFGNLNEKCGTGVAFTRNPSTGENKLYGEFLLNAQGEDVVAGIRTPLPIENLKNFNIKIYNELIEYAKKLENHFKDMQDIEFTIENEKLFVLQTRNGKRTPKASIKIVVDLVNEKKINKKQALLQLKPSELESVLHPVLDEQAIKKLTEIASGLLASPGGACGKIALSSEKAKQFYKEKQKVILIRLETSPEDIDGMAISEAILTKRGGMTSHAAVVARGMGIPCVVGCNDIEFINTDLNLKKNIALNLDDSHNKIKRNELQVKIGNFKFKEGDFISVDGSTGKIYKEKIDLLNEKSMIEFNTIIEWAKEFQKVGVRANADSPQDASTALNSGAEGIGLCRTEHMFFGEKRIQIMREVIIAENLKKRKTALDKLAKFQKVDFFNIFKEAKNKPVTIRLLDPPLHEFLPRNSQEIKLLAENLKNSIEEIETKITELQEINPMMGHRGLRLAISYPEIYEMQTKAIIQAAIDAQLKFGYKIEPEIMLPLTVSVREFCFVKELVKKVADETILNFNNKRQSNNSTLTKSYKNEKSAFENKNLQQNNDLVKINYKIGTMIETPRAALIAGELAKHVDFFSFGTNDLTQLVYAFSRDDAEKFLGDYFDKKVFKINPFEKLDKNGVGKIIKSAIKDARKVKPNLQIGVCGEHGGESDSIDFFVNSKFSYISCSPYRIPIAILSCAISNLKNYK